MRRRLIIVVLFAGALVLLTSCADDGGSSTSAVPGMEARTVASGAVELQVVPEQLDESGAVFTVAMDTHEGELAADLAQTATLEVGGQPWRIRGWTGDGPGGHHREGKLRFDASGPPRGEVTLNLAGFPEPVEVTWTVEA